MKEDESKSNDGDKNDEDKTNNDKDINDNDENDGDDNDNDDDFEIEPYSEADSKVNDDLTDGGNGKSSIEKIITDKYGAIGMTVYTLIDGEKSAEEIMSETGLTESRLIEILDFFEDKGIIKLEYPGKKNVSDNPTKSEGGAELDGSFNPMIDDSTTPSTPKGMSTIDVPVVLPLDIVKSVQLKAKIMLEFGNRGSSLFEAMNGKRNIIDITLDMHSTLMFVEKVLNFLMSNNVIIMKPMLRDDIKSKFGSDAYKVYKRFGRDGVLLYELIGKDLSIKQMMKKVTIDKDKFIDMFVFIHNVLGVPIPVEKDILRKKLD